jgi:NAD+ synthase
MDVQKTTMLIEDWIRMSVEKACCTGVVIGLSGGIDSAVVADLCTRALGVDSVFGMLLPCESSKNSVDDALTVVAKLGIRSQFVDLAPMLDALTSRVGRGLGQLPRANLKSRLRMCALYAMANQLNRLVCGTTNMTELFLGYFTKYGDGGCDIEPITHLLKREVREIAKLVGVPQQIIDKPPSADLWPGQTDEGEMGYTYDQLDDAVLSLISGQRPNEDSKVVERFVWNRFNATSHKRAIPSSCTAFERK